MDRSFIIPIHHQFSRKYVQREPSSPVRCGPMHRREEAKRGFSQLCKCFLSRWTMKFSYTISSMFDDVSRDMSLYVLKEKAARPWGPLVPVYQTTPWNTKEIPNLQNSFPEDLRDLTLACKRDLGCVVVAYDAVAWWVVTDAKGEHKTLLLPASMFTLA